MLNKRIEGFTLIELLIVMSVIITLMSVLIPNLTTARYRAQVASVMSELRTLQNALEVYAMDMGSYPGDTVAELDAFRLNYLNNKNPTWPWNRQDRILYADPDSIQEYTLSATLGYVITKEFPAHIREIVSMMVDLPNVKYIRVTPRGLEFLETL